MLYNFNQYVTHLWLQHAWWNFLFVSLAGDLWQGQNFVRHVTRRSVATVATDLIQLNWDSMGKEIIKIIKILEKLGDPENWGVI